MTSKEDEEERLRAVTLQNAQSILHARRRAEEELRRQSEWLRITLSSIGDAVISTDAEGRVAFMNGVAEALTGWSQADAVGQFLSDVFNIVNEQTRQPAENPALRALREGKIVGLANHTVLIARDGTERPIDDSAAPIRDDSGTPVGAVLVFRDITDRKCREVTQARLAAIVESSDDAIISKSLDGIIRSWNAAAERIFGYTAEQAVGRHISLIIPADRAHEEEHIIAELKAGRRVEHYDTVRIRSDGQAVEISLSISPLKDEAGRVIGASKIARDITAKRQAEERERLLLAEAASANAKFRAFFDQGAVFAGIMDVDGTIIEPNRLSWEGCGFTREQIVGKPFWEGPWWAPSPTLVDQIKAASAVAASGQTFRAEMPYFVADGSQRFADVTIQPIKDEAGHVLFLAPTGTDITDRKRAEEERQRFVTLVENSTDFIGMCDFSGAPIFINRAGLKMVGLEDIEEARKKSVWDFFFPEDQCRVQSEFFPSVLERGHGEIEIRFRHFKTGEALWLVYKVLALTNGDGATIGFATVSQDITQRRQLEDHLRKLAADLATAGRRKDEFLATLAHELRNPLGPIRSSLHLLRLSGDLSPSLEPVREIMERQVDHMIRLIDDLLDVSRISNNKIELRKETIALATVVAAAVETAQPLIDAAGHQLALSLPADPMMLDADPVRLTQVISNLLNNAAKYTKRGGQIWLTARNEGNEAVISIRDTGLGIPADMLPRVFDMFAQVDYSLTRAQGGLGIGLTLTKNFVEMHGGRIEAHSDGPDQGSEFVVYLPMTRDPQRRSTPATASRSSRTSYSRHRILIVDDTRAAAYILGKLLETMGQQVRTATNAAEALESVRSERPDLVISDIAMPSMDGYELAQRLRTEPGLEGLRLVALTGYGQDSDKQRAKEAGFDYHLIKPVSLEALQDLLGSLPASPEEGSWEQIQQRSMRRLE